MVAYDLPDVPPSLNKQLRMHWAVKKRLYEYWRSLVRSQIMPCPNTDTKMHAVITMYHSRAYDKDNAYGAVKPLIDALRHWQVIVNDTDEWLYLDVRQVKYPHKKRYTRILLERA